MTKNARKIMSFDWALKTVLRDKANFDVLEGFLSALLKQDITILELLESESNREEAELKSNRVDVLVKTEADERIIIEVQYALETDFLKRLLFGVSRVVVESICKGEPYAQVRKVISVSVVYFDMGTDDSDYVYHGTTEFRGIHSKKLMVCESPALYSAPRSRMELEHEAVHALPEYYVIPIKRFPDQVNDDLDEWIYALKQSEVPDTFHARNIDRMREKLDVLKMSPEEHRRYDNYLLRRASDEGVLRQAELESLERVAVKLLPLLDNGQIAEVTGLSLDEILFLRTEQKTKTQQVNDNTGRAV